MEKSGKGKNILLAVLLVAVLTLSIAYAVLSATLTINAQATVKGATNWNVHFQQKTGNDPICVASSRTGESTTASITNPGTLSADGTSFSGLQVEFRKPGDKVVCTWEVINAGTINAKLTTGTVVGTPTSTSTDWSTISNKINYSLTVGGVTPAEGQKLPATTGNVKEVVYTVEFDESATELPANDVAITGLNATLVYTQD